MHFSLKQFMNAVADYIKLLIPSFLLLGVCIVGYHEYKKHSSDTDAYMFIIMPIIAIVITKLLEIIHSDSSKREEVSKIKYLVTTDLVDLVTKLMPIEKLMKAAINTIKSGGSVPEHYNFDGFGTLQMQFAEMVKDKILFLTHKEIEVLLLINSMNKRIQNHLDEVTNRRKSFGLLAATEIRNNVLHNYKLIAEAFEYLAPDRKASFDENKEPILFTELLKSWINEEL